MFELNLNFRRIQALIHKEILQIFRDPSSILIAFIYPLLFLFIYGTGVSLDINNLPIAVVLEDTSAVARDFVFSMSFSNYLDVHQYNSRHEPIDLLQRGHVKGIVVIPSYFTQWYDNPNHEAPILIIADGSDPNTANFVLNYVESAWQGWEKERLHAQGMKDPSLIQIVPRVWYNEELKSQYFLMPGTVAIVMTVTGAMLTALVVAREWERGTMEALMTTPATIREIIFSKLIAYFFLGIGSMILCFLVGYFIYGVPFRGSFIGLASSSVSYLFYALGTGLLISTLTRDQFTASQMTIIISFLPSFILSGFIFDINNMPLYLRILTIFVPARYFVTNLTTLYLVGDVWQLLLPNICIMLLFAALFLWIPIKSSVKRLD